MDKKQVDELDYIHFSILTVHTFQYLMDAPIPIQGMTVLNPFSVLLLSNRPTNVQRVRDFVGQHPVAPAWWTLIFILVLSFSDIPVIQLIQHKTHFLTWTNEIMVGIILTLIGVLGVLLMNSLATLAILRQQRKTWGVALPDEPRVMWFRTGIWTGAATSYGVYIILKIVYVCFDLFLLAIHQKSIGILSTATGIICLLYFSYAIAYFYGIPKRLFVFRYVIVPVILISVVGIMLAITLGQYRQYHTLEVQHRSTVMKTHRPSSTLLPPETTIK